MFDKKGKKSLRDQVEDLADKIQPAVENAIEQLTPVLEDARDKAGDALAEARERFDSDVLPAVTAAVAEARERSEPMLDEARRRGLATAAAVKGEVDAPRKRSKVKMLLVIGGLVGIGAFLFKKLRGSGDSSWQSSYQPPAPPTPTPAPAAVGDDRGGASPDEAVADAAAGADAHPVTTPDSPVEETDVSTTADPDADAPKE